MSAEHSERPVDTAPGSASQRTSGAMAALVSRPSSHTVREFVFQLVTIIAGILIALSIDGLVELNRQRTVVRDAHAALAREIADNLDDLEGTLPALDEHERQLKQALTFADELLKSGKTDVHELQLSFSMPSLNRASWQTTERTGALAFMDFADVREYSEIYELRQFVVDSQRKLVERVSGMVAIIFAGPDGNPMLSRPEDVDAFRSRVLDAMGALTVHKSLVRSLAEAYKKAPRR